MSKETECFICGTHRPNSIESHHVVPRRYGGSDAPENLVNLCSSCHSAIEKLYDDSFYDRLGVGEMEKDMGRNIDLTGTTIPSRETKDRTYPESPVHVRREDFGLEISFTQFYLHPTEKLIPDYFPESNLLIQKLEDTDVNTLIKRTKEWETLGKKAKSIETVFPEDIRLTPPIRIVKSNPTLNTYRTDKNTITGSWFSRFHCGYCHTVYSQYEQADLAAHLRVQHRVENPYESEEGDSLNPKQI